MKIVRAARNDRLLRGSWTFHASANDGLPLCGGWNYAVPVCWVIDPYRSVPTCKKCLKMFF